MSPVIHSDPESLASFGAMVQQSLSLLDPPPALTVSEWADTFGRLSRESSSEPGQWYTARAEYQRGPMDAVTDPLLETIVLMWPSQVGKTAIALMVIGYFVEHDPAPILLVEPTLEIAEAVSKDRVAAMIRDTPVLKHLFGDPRSRDAGNTLLHKEFPGGQLTLAGANSAASLASRPIRILITDEEGRYPISAGTEGSPVKLAKKRTATFWNRKHLRISSPNLRKTCSITAAYEASDKRRYYVPCPQCGHFQTLRFDSLKWPSPKTGAPRHEPENCYYVCEQNGCVISETDKPEMIRKGEWRAEAMALDRHTAGFHINALYTTLGFSWVDIIHEFLDAKDNPSKLQTFVNTVLAEPWDEQGEGAEENQIAKRAEKYDAAAPIWVLMVTAGVDVQKDRLEGTKWGWGLREVSGAIEHKVFRGDPARPEIWAELLDWLNEPIIHETGLRLRTACTLVDSGDGNRTQAVYKFCRKHELDHIYACKGSSQAGAPLVNQGKRVGRNRTLLVMVGASTAKDEFFSKLKIESPDAAGYIHFPLEASDWPDYYSQLTAEVLVTRSTRSGDQSVWIKKRRNEALDCAVYAMGAREFRRPNFRALAKNIQTQSEAIKVEAEAAAVAGKPLEPKPQSSVKKYKKTLRIPGAGWING